MKKKLILAAVLLAVGVGGGLAIKHKRAQIAARATAAIPPVAVETRRLNPSPVSLTLPATAEVLALREAVLASRYAAYVTDLTRFEGDRFRKGDVLARLDASQAEADLARANAQLAQTRLQEGTLASDRAAAQSLVQSEEERVARLVELHKIGGVALEQVQAGQSALAAARARLAAAQAAADSYRELSRASESQAHAARENLRYGVITAPFDGVVSQRLAQPGDLAVPGKPLLKIVDPAAGNRLLVSVPQALRPSALVVNGQRLALNPWPEAAGQGMARYEARAKLGLSPGSKVDAALEVYRAEAGILVPRTCLAGDDGHTARLLRVDGGQAKAVTAALAGQGAEGVVLADAALAGAAVICASPDILARVQAGAPFRRLDATGK